MNDKQIEDRGITVAQAKDIIREDMEYRIEHGARANARPTIIMWGPVGIGKTGILYQLADEMDALFGHQYDQKLATRDPLATRGVPWADKENMTTIWPRPDMFPPTTIKQSLSMLFVDEINQLSEAMQAVAMPLVHERKLGEWKLPDHTYLIAAGNMNHHNAGRRMKENSALNNRLNHLYLVPSLDVTLAHFTEQQIDWRIRTFLDYRPELLHKYDPEAEGHAFPTPRSWEFAHHILHGSKLPADLRQIRLEGTIGKGAAAEFAGMLNNIDKLPKMADIEATPDTAPMGHSASVVFILMSSLAERANPTNLKAYVTYIKRYGEEWHTLFCRCLKRRTEKMKSDDRKRIQSVADYVHLRANLSTLTEGDALSMVRKA